LGGGGQKYIQNFAFDTSQEVNMLVLAIGGKKTLKQILEMQYRSMGVD